MIVSRSCRYALITRHVHVVFVCMCVCGWCVCVCSHLRPRQLEPSSCSRRCPARTQSREQSVLEKRFLLLAARASVSPLSCEHRQLPALTRRPLHIMRSSLSRLQIDCIVGQLRVLPLHLSNAGIRISSVCTAWLTNGAYDFHYNHHWDDYLQHYNFVIVTRAFCLNRSWKVGFHVLVAGLCKHLLANRVF